MIIGDIETQTDNTRTDHSSMASNVPPSKKTIDTNKSDLMMFMALCDKLVSATERTYAMSKQDEEFRSSLTRFNLCLQKAQELLDIELNDLTIARRHRVVPQKGADW